MSLFEVDRRRLLVGAGALGAAAALATPASAKGSVTAAIYPGTWDEAFRSIVAPALKQTKDIDLALEPLFAVDQIAKAQAARGAPPFDAFVLDPGPRATACRSSPRSTTFPSRCSYRTRARICCRSACGV
jgi:putative spermidine/putrescine transport system substrate-binding protein